MNPNDQGTLTIKWRIDTLPDGKQIILFDTDSDFYLDKEHPITKDIYELRYNDLGLGGTGLYFLDNLLSFYRDLWLDNNYFSAPDNKSYISRLKKPLF